MSEEKTKQPKVLIIILAIFSVLTVYFSLETGLLILKSYSLLIRYALLSMTPFLVVLVLAAALYFKDNSALAVFFVELTSVLSGIVLIFFLFIWLKHCCFMPGAAVSGFFKNISRLALIIKYNLSFFAFVSPVFIIFVFTVIDLYHKVFSNPSSQLKHAENNAN